MPVSRAVTEFLAESEASRACLMAPLTVADSVPILEWTHKTIPADVLAKNGYEAEMHATVLFGFDESVTAEHVAKAVLEDAQTRVVLELGRISRFEQPAYDVLVVEVESPSLRQLNAFLVEKFGKCIRQTYPEYTPHLTLAYVKSGACPELNGHCRFVGQVYPLQELVYSSPNSEEKTRIPLAGKSGF